MRAFSRHYGIAALVLISAVPACNDSSSGASGSDADAGRGGAGKKSEAVQDAGGGGGSGGMLDAGGSSDMTADAAVPTDASQPDDTLVEIHFRALAGGQDVTCTGMYAGLGSSASTLNVADLRLFVHDLRLIDDSGAETPIALEADDSFQSDSVALLDFEDGTGNCQDNGTRDMHEVIRGHVEPGNYTGLAFTVGLPDADNHADPTLAKAPLDVMSMHWSWNDGYRFLRLDAFTDAGDFNVHLGSTQCTASDSGDVTCNQANRPEVRLSQFDPEQDEVVLDLAALLADSDLSLAPGCIAGATDDVCAPVMQHLGIDPGTGEADPTQQDAFRAEPR